MKAVILVGGEGTRLRPLTCNTVKAMVPVLNRPFLEHMICYLRSYEIRDIILTLCHLPDSIRSYFGDGSKFGVKLTYIVEESPLGTAGAVKNAQRYLDEPFFILNGDIFTDLDLGAMLAFYKQTRAKVSIALTPVENPTIYGVVETDAQGRVRHFIEKPAWGEVTTNLINAGIYLLNPEVLSGVPQDTHFMFEHHLFPQLLDKGESIYGYSSEAYWIDIGTPEKYLKLHHDLLKRYGEGLTTQYSIHPSAQTEGKVLIGSECHIGPRVRIEGPATLGPGSRIEEGAQISGAVLWRNVQVGRQAILENCIAGDNCFIGSGSFIPQGSVLGDNVVIESKSNLPPSSRIWPGTKVVKH